MSAAAAADAIYIHAKYSKPLTGLQETPPYSLSRPKLTRHRARHIVSPSAFHILKIYILNALLCSCISIIVENIDGVAVPNMPGQVFLDLICVLLQ